MTCLLDTFSFDFNKCDKRHLFHTEKKCEKRCAKNHPASINKRKSFRKFMTTLRYTWRLERSQQRYFFLFFAKIQIKTKCAMHYYYYVLFLYMFALFKRRYTHCIFLFLTWLMTEAGNKCTQTQHIQSSEKNQFRLCVRVRVKIRFVQPIKVIIYGRNEPIEHIVSSQCMTFIW